MPRRIPRPRAGPCAHRPVLHLLRDIFRPFRYDLRVDPDRKYPLFRIDPFRARHYRKRVSPFALRLQLVIYFLARFPRSVIHIRRRNDRFHFLLPVRFACLPVQLQPRSVFRHAQLQPVRRQGKLIPILRSALLDYDVLFQPVPLHDILDIRIFIRILVYCKPVRILQLPFLRVPDPQYRLFRLPFRKRHRRCSRLRVLPPQILPRHSDPVRRQPHLLPFLRLAQLRLILPACRFIPVCRFPQTVIDRLPAPFRRVIIVRGRIAVYALGRPVVQFIVPRMRIRIFPVLLYHARRILLLLYFRCCLHRRCLLLPCRLHRRFLRLHFDHSHRFFSSFLFLCRMHTIHKTLFCQCFISSIIIT